MGQAAGLESCEIWNKGTLQIPTMLYMYEGQAAEHESYANRNEGTLQPMLKQVALPATNL